MIGVIPIRGFEAAAHCPPGRRSRRRARSAPISRCAEHAKNQDRLEFEEPHRYWDGSSGGAHSVVDRRLSGGRSILGPFPERAKKRAARKTHAPQIGRVYLRVPIKAAKILVNHRRIEKNRQTAGQFLGKGFSSFMEDIQVVFKTDKLAGKTGGVNYACYDSTPLFL